MTTQPQNSSDLFGNTTNTVVYPNKERAKKSKNANNKTFIEKLEHTENQFQGEDVPMFVPAYSITPQKIVLYDRFIGPRSHYSGKSLIGYENLKDNENITGDLSRNAERRLLRAADYMFYLSGEKTTKGQLRDKVVLLKDQDLKTKQNEDIGVIPEKDKGQTYQRPVNYRIGFITLTLASKQIHSDNEIKAALLNHFLVELRKKFGVQMYLWKAEKQKNQNIHFHILVDRFIHWRKLRTVWNRIQNKLGYVDRYRKNMEMFYTHGFKPSKYGEDKRSIKEQLRAYKRGVKCGWSDPNSTDIHALYKVKNMRSYITKYLTKSTDKGSLNRAETMKGLNKHIQELKLQIEAGKSRINDSIFTKDLNFQGEKDIRNMIESNNIKIKELTETLRIAENEFNEMKKYGVEGRIWGTSQLLSKFKNLGDLGDPPAMDLIEQYAEKVYNNEIGTGKYVVTYIIDFNKVPELKKYFDGYIEDVLRDHAAINNPNILKL